MERRAIEKYIKTVEMDVKFVDEAIKKGARLSLEEWHDFVFKSEIGSFKSGVLAKYATARPKAFSMAKIGAIILENIITVQLGGFTESKARRMVGSVVRKYNKLRTLADRMTFYGEDADGTVTFTVEPSDRSCSVEMAIISRDSLCYFLQDLWTLMVHDIRIFNEETRSFLIGHLDNEIKIICAGAKPSPYIGCLRCNTLNDVLLYKTDYENARKTPVSRSDSSKSVANLKVANGGSYIKK